MSSVKRSSPLKSVSQVLRRALGFGQGLRPSVVLTVGMLLGFPLVIWLAWNRWGSAVVNDPRYRITADAIEVPAAPSWIHRDIKADVVREGSLTELSLLDSEVTVKVARAFELNSWVRHVESVSKRPGPKVIVNLVYRRPVIMVAATGGGFWPVDSEGVLLPPDEFAPEQTKDFLRLDAADVDPTGPVGTVYADQRVTGAARIATLLIDEWRPLGLRRMVAKWDSDSPSARAVPLFELFSEQGTRIVWGHAPGSEVAGEVRASEKISRLREFVARNGSLTPESILELDLRNASGVAAIPNPATLRQVRGEY